MEIKREMKEGKLERMERIKFKGGRMNKKSKLKRKGRKLKRKQLEGSYMEEKGK